MKIFNTYTNQLEEFIPIHEGKVNMYVCGPTVYNYIHIGNARPVIFFDTVRKYFEHRGYEVKFASNFTDVDDKIITKALELEVAEREVSEKFIAAFLADVERVNASTDYIQPKVTEYMDQIIHYIEMLVDKDFAYEVDGDVYFRVEHVKEYGKLSNRNIQDLISGSRIEINNKKENPLDFTLWKKTDVGIQFDSRFGKGRPGWHTECVAMIDNIFGEKINTFNDKMFIFHMQAMWLTMFLLINYKLTSGFKMFYSEFINFIVKISFIIRVNLSKLFCFILIFYYKYLRFLVYLLLRKFSYS
jgi:cysteinyl-tRNA synthetase